MTPVDVIGDVHGQRQKLVELLRHLGYRESAGVFRHDSRKALFLGDLIDRGPDQLATVELVRRMVYAGTARCIVGNHEFNAMAWVTPDADRPGEYLRPHNPTNLHQHQAFLQEVEGTARHLEIIEWFGTLPLWIDLGGLRVVHACWHQASMDVLQPLLGPRNTVSAELLRQSSRRGSPAFAALEVICKGPEVRLPAGVEFQDKDGKTRREVRVRWWQRDLSTYRKAAIGPAEDMDKIPDLPMPGDWQGHPYSGPPVLFGHYWFTGTPQVISPQFACLDYSAARQGHPLVAYRWDGEALLASHKLAWVDPA